MHWEDPEGLDREGGGGGGIGMGNTCKKKKKTTKGKTCVSGPSPEWLLPGREVQEEAQDSGRGSRMDKGTKANAGRPWRYCKFSSRSLQ